MDLSIIIPCYNVEKYIESCLNSISCLEDVQYEVIVINDGSTDLTAREIEKVREHSAFPMMVCEQENQGTAAARNRGMQFAKGEFLFFLDADDRVYAKNLRNLLQAAREDDADLAFADYCKCIKGKRVVPGTVLRRRKILKRQQGVLSGVRFAELTFDRFTNYISSEMAFCLVKRDFIEKNALTFHPEIYHEDTLFFHECIVKATRVKYYDELFYEYNIHEDSKEGDIKKEAIRMRDKLKLAEEIMHIKEQDSGKYYFLDSYIINLLYTARKYSTKKPYSAVYKKCYKFTMKSKLIRLLLKLEGYL